MQDREINIIEYVECLVDTIFGAFISMIWYKNLLFRCLFDLTYKDSKLVLWGMIIGVTIIMRTIIYKKHSTWSLISSLLLSYGAYTALTYWNTIGGRIQLILGSAFGVAFLLCVLVMTRSIPNKRRRKRIIKRRVHNCVINTFNIVAVAMAVIMIPMITDGALGNSLFDAHTEAKAGVSVNQQTLSGNIDTVLKLQENEWAKLSTNEKLDVMQTVANIEAHYLGVPNEINVGIANLREGTLACYSDSKHMVYISLDHMETDTASEILNSCCHEVFHCYQHRLIDAFNNAGEELKELRIFKEVTAYKDEFDSYVDGHLDPCAYYFQQCEQDARKYAESAVEDYYARIEDYLESY